MESKSDRLPRYRKAIAAEPLFVAYNANVDVIVHVDDEVADTLGPPGETHPDQLDSARDLATAIAVTMAAGEGDEIPVTEAFAGWLADHLTPDERRLGGQAGISADVTASVGADPLLFTYLLSEEQVNAFTTPHAIRSPAVEDGAVEYRPLEDMTNADETKINWIFEFTEGDTFYGTRATADTRLIAATRPQRFNLDAGELKDAIDQVGTDVNGAILAGYQSLRERYDDGATAVDRIPDGRRFIERLQGGGDPLVQVEFGVTHQADLRSAIVEEILPRADAVGVDAHELRLLAEDLGVSGKSGGIVETVARSRAVREAIGVDCLKLHTTEYFLAITDGYQPPSHVREGFDFASIVAATKASLGTVSCPGDLRIGVACERSEEGVAAVKRLADHLNEEPVDDGIATPTVVAQPNRVVEDPVSTVGIGDAVSASSFLLETALADRP